MITLILSENEKVYIIKALSNLRRIYKDNYDDLKMYGEDSCTENYKRMIDDIDKLLNQKLS